MCYTQSKRMFHYCMQLNLIAWLNQNLKLLADIILHLSLKYPDLLELNKENT